MEQLIQDLINLAWTHTFYDFWIPVILCVFGFFYTTVEDYGTDKKNRTDYEAWAKEYNAMTEEQRTKNRSFKSYTPTLAVGNIVGRAVVTVIPVVNVYYGIKFLFTIGKDIQVLFGKWLNIPLVPKREVETAK